MIKMLGGTISPTGREKLWRDPSLEWRGRRNQLPQCASTVEDGLTNRGGLMLMRVVFAAASVATQKYIDKDKHCVTNRDFYR